MLHFIYCYAECHYAECGILFIVMLNVIMQSAVTLYVILQCRYADCHYAKCRYAERHYAECRGALDDMGISKDSYKLLTILLVQCSILRDFLNFQLHSRKHFKNDRKMITRNFVNNIPETLKGQKMLWACVKQSVFLKL